MKITIVYDNEVRKVGLRQGHGFSALIEDAEAPPLLQKYCLPSEGLLFY